MNPRAAIYVRVSTEEQARDGYSIEAQINVLKLYAKLYNLNIIKIYKDEGISGKDLNRENIKKLLVDAKKKKFDTVLVWKVSRLSRNLKNLLTIVETLDRYNISFISQSETFNTSTPVGRMTLQILGSIAEFERNTIIENIKLALNEKAKRGEWLGGKVFGYKNINKKLIPDESETEIVKYIFKSYIKGNSIKKIVDYLNTNNKLVTKKFNVSLVYRILKNPIYCGILRHKNQNNKDYYEIKGIHKPIISKSLFNKAQKQIANNKKQYIRDGEFVLSGLLKCPHCGKSLVRYKTSKYRYYRCSTYHNFGKNICKGILINANEIESKVFLEFENALDKEKYKILYDVFEIGDVFEKSFKFSAISYAKKRDILHYFITKIVLTENKTIDKIIYAK